MTLTDSAPKAEPLMAKWRRDSDLAVEERLVKAGRLLADRSRARFYLRKADAGPRVRVVGRPRLVVDGALLVGPDCIFRSIVAPIDIYVARGATLIIGRDVRMNSGDTISALSRVEIGDRVEIGPHVTVHDNSYHDLYDRNAVPESRPVVIEDDVWLTSRCTVLPGVRIGRGAVVSANSLVTRNVEPFTVVCGVPAQPVARLNEKKFVSP